MSKEKRYIPGLQESPLVEGAKPEAERMAGGIDSERGAALLLAECMSVTEHARNTLRRSFCAACWDEFFLYEKMGRRAIVSAGNTSEAEIWSHPTHNPQKTGFQRDASLWQELEDSVLEVLPPSGIGETERSIIMKNMGMEEKTIDTKRIYEGRILNLRVDKVLLPNGRESFREVVEHHGAVCVVPITAEGMVYMVRQFRYPFNETVLEIPAGKLDPGEQIWDAANRELEEEIGQKAAELIYIGDVRPSVAYLTEVIHMFMARGLTPTRQHLDEDEFLEVETYSLDALTDMILENKITDSKTIAALLKAKLLLDREKERKQED